MTAPMTCQVIEECIVFLSPVTQMGGGKKNMHDSLGIVEHMWNPPFTTCFFPQAAGKNTANACWRDSDFCSNCHA